MSLLRSPLAAAHPLVVSRRAHERFVVAAAAAIPVAIALAVAVVVPKPNIALVFGITIGGLGVAALMVSTRYEVTLAFLAIYLGMLDGPIKLQAPSPLTSAIRDVLILAVALGMVLRIVVSRERVTLPPLSAWVLGFVAVVLIQGVNPNTGGIAKSIGGYRQELEWVPFFFFGYLLIRSKRRFRQLFLIIGVIALANGAVGAVQSRLSPGQLSSWGPGYRTLIEGGSGGITGRTYVSEGVSHPRPLGLGSDSGFGGAVGALALPCLMALLVAGGLRRRWPVLLCCSGALLGVASAASRTSIIMAIVGLVSFGLLSLIAGLRIARPLAALAGIVALAVVVGAVLVAIAGPGVFQRAESLTSSQKAQETGGSSKARVLSQIPFDIEHAPFGVGLGTAGSVGGFGGGQHVRVEGLRLKAGSAYNLVTKELGLPGLLLWVGFSINVIVLGIGGLRRVADRELRAYMVGLLSAYLAITADGLSGATLAVTVGLFLWFVPGVIAYWFGTRQPQVSPMMTAEAT
jgi:hypothetical protein